MDTIDEIYFSLLGQLEPEAAMPWVENAFTAGSECESHLIKIYDARNRLLERLHVEEDDEDLECIMDSFLSIQYTLCRKMYFYGMQQ